MDPETNKALVLRYIHMWNTGDVALADEVLAPTWIDYAHPEVIGPEAVKRAVNETKTAFPDFHITIEHILSEGDMAALRGTIHRTQQGQEVVSHIMWFARIANGQMQEWWTGSETSR